MSRAFDLEEINAACAALRAKLGCEVVVVMIERAVPNPDDGTRTDVTVRAWSLAGPVVSLIALEAAKALFDVGARPAEPGWRQ